MNKLGHILLFSLLMASLYAHSNRIPGIKEQEIDEEGNIKKEENKILKPFTNKKTGQDAGIKSKTRIDSRVHIKEDIDPYNPEKIIGIKHYIPEVIIPNKSRQSREYRSMKGLVKQKKEQISRSGQVMVDGPKYYQFKTDSCTFRASYDPNKIDLKTLKNTRLLEFTDEFTIKTPVFLEDYLLEPEEASLGIRRLTKECEKKLQTLEDVNAFITTPYVENFRYRTYKTSFESCKAKYYILQSYDSIEILSDYPYPNDENENPNIEKCRTYTDALSIGKEYLVEFWTQMKLEQNPEIESKLRKPGKNDMVFDILKGWHDCVIDSFKKPVIDPDNNDFLNIIEDLDYKCKKPEEYDEDEEDYEDEDY